MLFNLFLEDSQQHILVRMSQALVRDAASLLLVRPRAVRPRTLDALHLVSARHAFRTARRRGIRVGSFVSADRALLAAAEWAGLTVQNPEDHA